MQGGRATHVVLNLGVPVIRVVELDAVHGSYGGAVAGDDDFVRRIPMHDFVPARASERPRRARTVLPAYVIWLSLPLKTVVRSYVEPTPVSPSLVFRTRREGAVRSSAGRRRREGVKAPDLRSRARRLPSRGSLGAQGDGAIVGTRLLRSLDSRIPRADVCKLRCKRPGSLAADGHCRGKHDAHSCSGAVRWVLSTRPPAETLTTGERDAHTGETLTTGEPSKTPEGVRRARVACMLTSSSPRHGVVTLAREARSAGASLPLITAARSKPAPALPTPGYS